MCYTGGMKRLVIIDGKSVFYRGYYAMGALSMSEGMPTGGIYGFAAIAMEIVRKLDPTKVVVAWDSKTSANQRKAIYPEYKAGRTKPGEDFYAQIPALEELVKALGWSFVEVDNYEADDIIGTLALQADQETDCSQEDVLGSDSGNLQDAMKVELNADSSQDAIDDELGSSCSTSGWETYIVSSDLDMLQVVDENTRMYRLLKGFTRLEELDVPAVEEKYGIRKAQFLDLKALKGDASDNIPGVPGIGERTAVKLLNEYGDLDGIYAHLDEIKGAAQKKLREGEASARMSYDLAKIRTDAPVELASLPNLVIDEAKIVAALEKLEFKSLIGRFVKARKWQNRKQTGEQTGIWSSKTGSESAQDSPQEAEKSGSRGSKVRQNGVSAGLQSGGGADFGGTQRKKVDPAAFWQQTLEIPVELPNGLLVSWDVKNLMHKNAKIAEKVLAGGQFWDLTQGAFLLNPLARGIEYSDEKEEYERQKREFEARTELYRIFVEFDLPLIPVLYQMEQTGMLIDRDYFEAMKREFGGEVGSLERQIWDLAGREFNVNSPMQLAEVLFEDLRLPTKGIKKSSRGYSTGVKELDKLKDQHPIIEKIKEYRELAKLLSTYIAPLPELADANGRVHTTFNQNVTATGRLSSTNPNLQNIPVRTEIGRRIRKGFIAGPGKVFVSADYSQFELRLAAALANDEGLIQDFNDDVDIHTKTAAEAFKIPMAEVTKVQRRVAKVINFGILYGMSTKGLSEAADMRFYEAKNFIENYFELRKKIKEYLDGLLVQAREQGYVETLFGRRRPTPDVLSSNFVVRTAAERAAQNMPIQGTEADLMKRAMIQVSRELEKRVPGAEMVVQVHDSVIVECDEGQAEEVSRVLKERMEGVAPEIGVKLKVDVSVGKDWGEL